MKSKQFNKYDGAAIVAYTEPDESCHPLKSYLFKTNFICQI
jgi:hypothetical protein